MPFSDHADTPWWARWVGWSFAVFLLMIVLFAPSCVTRTVRQVGSGWSDALQGSDSSSSGTSSARSSDNLSVVWCPQPRPTIEQIAAADLTPDPSDSPLNRLGCDGWFDQATGRVLWTDEAVQRLPVSVLTGGTNTQPTDSTPTPSLTSQEKQSTKSKVPTVGSVTWVVVKVLLAMIILTALVLVLMKLVRRVVPSRHRTQPTFRGGSQFRAAFDSAEESGTFDDDMDTVPNPPPFPMPD